MSDVQVNVDGPIMKVTLCRPERRNAQTPATWRALADAGRAMTADVRVVLVSAEGPSFSAGLDRAMMTPEGVPGEGSMLDLLQHDEATLDAFIVAAQAGFTWLQDTDAVTMAVVNGHAIGAGMQLALACDLIVAGPDAQFAMRETSLGLVPDLAGTSPLVRRVGYHRALDICATGRVVLPEEALQIGLVERVAMEPLAAAHALLQELLAAPPAALRALKPLLQTAGITDPAQQRAHERVAQIARLQDIGGR